MRTAERRGFVMLPYRLSSYLAVAGCCALTNVAVLLAGDGAGLHFLLSGTVSFVACVLLGFGLHSRFTFREPMRIGRLWRYAGAMALNYPLSLVALWLFYDALALPMIAAAPFSTAALTAYNYLSSRWAIASPA